jgi:Protein of unknown function (DUF2586)
MPCIYDKPKLSIIHYPLSTKNMGNITFDIKKGGLKRTAEGEDHISAIAMSIAPPTSWTGEKAKVFNSLQDIEGSGILETGVFGEVWYQCWAFFRMQPSGTLYLILNVAAVDMKDTLVVNCQGRVRQLAAYVDDVTKIGSVWQALANACELEFCPLSIVLGWTGASLDPAQAVNNMGTKNAKNVSLVAAGSNSAKVVGLATALGKPYIPAIGAVLGAISKAKVSESPAWVEKFNYSDGSDLEEIRLANGVTKPTLAQGKAFDDARIIVFLKHTNYGGTYLNDSFTCTDATDDFATIENNRTMGKAMRGLRKAMLPHISRPMNVDAATGLLAVGTISFYENEANTPLDVMEKSDEVSGFYVYIDPNQQPIRNGKLNIEAGIVPLGKSKEIHFKIGFSLALRNFT